eukprot:scaffold77878_cov55-Phaeocystis_antarctica.AAC.4
MPKDLAREEDAAAKTIASIAISSRFPLGDSRKRGSFSAKPDADTRTAAPNRTCFTAPALKRVENESFSSSELTSIRASRCARLHLNSSAIRALVF